MENTRMAKQNCPTCYSYDNGYKKGVLKCPNCHGEGSRADILGSRTTCSQCDGAGYKRCPNCQGSGEIDA
jgi:DnaJ-class molecular chaperone